MDVMPVQHARLRRDGEMVELVAEEACEEDCWLVYWFTGLPSRLTVV